MPLPAGYTASVRSSACHALAGPAAVHLPPLYLFVGWLLSTPPHPICTACCLLVQNALSDVLLCQHFVSESCLDRKPSDDCVDDLVDELTDGVHPQLKSMGQQQQQQQQPSPPVAAASTSQPSPARAAAIAVPVTVAGGAWPGVDCQLPAAVSRV